MIAGNLMHFAKIGKCLCHTGNKYIKCLYVNSQMAMFNQSFMTIDTINLQFYNDPYISIEKGNFIQLIDKISFSFVLWCNKIQKVYS